MLSTPCLDIPGPDPLLTCETCHQFEWSGVGTAMTCRFPKRGMGGQRQRCVASQDKAANPGQDSDIVSQPETVRDR